MQILTSRTRGSLLHSSQVRACAVKLVLMYDIKGDHHGVDSSGMMCITSFVKIGTNIETRAHTHSQTEYGDLRHLHFLKVRIKS